ncbi:MAG: DUF5683 domain-containing protein [bacterium]
MQAPVLNHPGYLTMLENTWPQSQSTGFTGEKSVSKSLLMSAAVPGLGQAYNRSYLKAGIFVAIEAAALFITIDQHNKGNQREDEFEVFANLYWDEDTYWNALSAESGIDRSQMDALRAWERQNFSHHLPEDKNQTYFENIGKYNQFNIGWDDAIAHRERDSAHREQYTFMRRDANDAFELSRTFSTVIILNHIVSALEAAYTTHKGNTKLSTAMRFRPMRYNGDYIPAMTLRVAW